MNLTTHEAFDEIACLLNFWKTCFPFFKVIVSLDTWFLNWISNLCNWVFLLFTDLSFVSCLIGVVCLIIFLVFFTGAAVILFGKLMLIWWMFFSVVLLIIFSLKMHIICSFWIPSLITRKLNMDIGTYSCRKYRLILQS